MEKKFSSISEEVKALINEFMETVKGECERREIVFYVREHISNKEKLTDGIMAGGIKMMTASGELVVVNRARYRKGVKIDRLCLKERVITLFENFQRDLNKACTVNLLGASVEDMEFIKKVNEISNYIESATWKLEESKEEKSVPVKVVSGKPDKKTAAPV